MKKVLSLSFILSSILVANSSIKLNSVEVVEVANKKVVKNVSQEQIKSADLAQALTENLASISLVRRSGIANDIILRGQKKDNINVLIDNSKIYGACPNRMDPATSHILTNNIDEVEIIEGPYDVENFGTLSGLVRIQTKKPTKDLSGELSLNLGSFSYKKASFSLNGGNDFIKLLLSASKEESKPYKDGNGNDFLAQQIENKVMMPNRYKNSDEKAFEKNTVLTKAFVNLNESSDLIFSYTANRSDNVLYPNTPMDADYDDSDIYTLEFIKRDLSKYSKQLNLEYYYSKVDHPMSVRLRNNSMMMKNMTNHMKSSIWGAKLKNELELGSAQLNFGIDTSTRNWRGRKYNSNLSMNKISLSSSDTKNLALFSSYKNNFGNFDLELGLRFDKTKIEVSDESKKDKDYDELNAYIFSVYNLNNDDKIFAGLGKSSRVPDARELYYVGAGNENLELTKNYEFDLGFEKNLGNFNLKTKLFYSKLEDYIYNIGTFKNIDAKIYGVDVSGFYLFNDKFSLDYALAYQRGKKDGDFKDKDLAEIPPLKANIAFNYNYNNSKFTTEFVAVDKWDTYDSSAKEQALPGYAFVNLRYKNTLNKNLTLSLGIDNIFDKTYVSTNTYQDIRYVEVGGNRTLLNEPGRYFYANIKYSF